MGVFLSPKPSFADSGGFDPYLSVNSPALTLSKTEFRTQIGIW